MFGWVKPQVQVVSPAVEVMPVTSSGLTALESVAQGSGGGSSQLPVGFLLILTVNTNPATLLGYGTWAALGAGRTLVGYDAGDSDFNAAKKTGGAKTVAISAHSGTAVADHPAGVTGQASAGATQRGTTSSTLTLAAHTHTTPALTHSVTQPSDHAAVSVVQPYLVVYFWERTA